MTVSMRAIVTEVLCTRLKFIFLIFYTALHISSHTWGKAVECESSNVAFEWPALCDAYGMSRARIAAETLSLHERTAVIH